VIVSYPVCSWRSREVGVANRLVVARLPANPETLQLDMPVEVAFERLDDDITPPALPPGAEVTR